MQMHVSRGGLAVGMVAVPIRSVTCMVMWHFRASMHARALAGLQRTSPWCGVVCRKAGQIDDSQRSTQRTDDRINVRTPSVLPAASEVSLPCSYFQQSDVRVRVCSSRKFLVGLL